MEMAMQAYLMCYNVCLVYVRFPSFTANKSKRYIDFHNLLDIAGIARVLAHNWAYVCSCSNRSHRMTRLLTRTGGCRGLRDSYGVVALNSIIVFLPNHKLLLTRVSSFSYHRQPSSELILLFATMSFGGNNVRSDW